MKKFLRASSSTHQQQVRQVVTPQRPITQKQKNIEAEIAKLNTELDLEQFSPQLQSLTASNYLNNSRRTLAKEQKQHTVVYKNQIQKVHRRTEAALPIQGQQFQTISPVTRLRVSTDVPHSDNLVLASTNSHKRLPDRSSIDAKRYSDQNRQELSLIQTPFLPKSSQINYTASVQSYKNKRQKQIMSHDISQHNQTQSAAELEPQSDSDQIINVSTQAYQTNQNPKVNSLHQGIQFLQSNLKQLEGKYHDLAKFYNKKERPSQSPKKKLQKKKAPLSEQRENQKRKDLKHPENTRTDSQKHLNLQIQSAYNDGFQIETNIVPSPEDPISREFEQIMLFYKHQLNLKSEKVNIYQMLREDLHRLICTKSASPLNTQEQNQQSIQPSEEVQNIILDLEFGIAEQKEAIFKIKHFNEQTRLEQKKALHLLQSLNLQDSTRITEITGCLNAGKDRLQLQLNQFGALESFHEHLGNSLLSLSSQIKQPNQTSNGIQQQEVETLQAKILEVNANHFKQVQELEKLTVDLQIQNKDLQQKLIAQAQELDQKQLVLTQRETQKQELMKQLHQLSLTTRDQRSIAGQEERWRHQLETLVHLTTRFLNSMRRLQKLVHKREPNVTAEKQDFENAKKDLEITLKTAFSSLQLASGGRQSSASDQMSEVPHKHAKSKDQANASETVVIQQPDIRSENLIKQLTSDLETMRQRVASAVKERQQLEIKTLQFDQGKFGIMAAKEQIQEMDKQQLDDQQKTVNKLEALEKRLPPLLRKVSELSDLLRIQHQKQTAELKQRQQEFEESTAILKDSYQEHLQEQQQQFEQEINKFKLEISQLSQEVSDKCQSTALAEQITSLEQQAQTALRRAESQDKTIQKLKMERDQLTEQVKSLEGEHHQLQGLLKTVNKNELTVLRQDIEARQVLVQDLNKKIETLSKQLVMSDGQKSEIERQLQNSSLLNKENDLKHQSILAQHVKQIQALQSACSTHEVTIATNENERQELESIIKQLKHQHQQVKDSLTEQLDVKKEETERLGQEIIEKLEIITQLGNSNKQTYGQNTQLQSQHQDAQSEIIKLKAELLSSNETVEALKEQHQSQTQELLTQSERLKQELKSSLEKIAETKEATRRLNEQINQQTSSFKDIKLTLKKKEQQVRDLEDQIQDLQSQLNSHQQQVESKNLELGVLNKNIIDLRTKLEIKSQSLENHVATETQLKIDLEKSQLESTGLQSQLSDALLSLQKTSNVNSKLNQQLTDLTSQKDDQTVQSQQKMIQELQLELDQAAAKFSEQKLKLDERTEELASVSCKVTIQNQQSEQLAVKLDDKNQLIVSLQDQLLSSQQFQIESSSQLKSLQVEHEEVVVKLQKAERNEQILQTRIDELGNQVCDLESQEADRIKTLENNHDLIQKLKQQLQKSLFEKKEYKDAIQEANRVRDDLQSQCNTLCGFVLEANDENKRLESNLQHVKIQANELIQYKQESVTKQSNLIESMKSLKINFLNVKESLKQFRKDTLSNFTSFSNEILSALDQNQTVVLQEKNELVQKYKELESSVASSESADQTSYIQKLKQHFFQQEQHIEQLTSEAEVQKRRFEQDLESAAIQLESEKLKYIALFDEQQELKQVNAGLQSELAVQNEELDAKNELLEEANNFISDFNEEKHELKAKFKLLMGNLNNENSVSSYRSSDEIDLDYCFEQLEAELIRRDENQNSRILQITQERDAVNQELSTKENILTEREAQLQSLKLQLEKIETSLTQNEQAIQVQLEFASAKIQKYKAKVKDLRQKNQNIKPDVQPVAIPLEKPSESFVSQNSLVAENQQLLDRLQRTETLLKQARDSKSVSQKQLPVEQLDRLQEFEQRLDGLRRQVIASTNEMRDKILTKTEQELVRIKSAYIQDNIVGHNVLATSIIHSWNNLVELVSSVSVRGCHYLLIQTQDKRFYFVNEQDLTEQAYRYLKSFTDSDNCIVWKPQEDDDETVALQQLVSDLKQDLTDLRLEYLQYRTLDKLEFNPGEDNAGLLDEIEYLTGENKDLHLKVKEICLQNAELRLQLAMRLELHLEEENLNDGDGLIETARNISAMIDQDGVEHKERSDFISDRDSFEEVVDGMNPLETHIEKQLLQANLKIEALTEQLQMTTSQASEKEEDETTIAHIKGTLLQFLKLTPFTENKNEELLKIIYSMMEFTPAEISELQAQRMVLKGNNKVVQQLAMQGSGSRSNTSGMSSEGEKKIKKGIMSLFSKNKQKAEANNSQNYQTPQPPVKK